MRASRLVSIILLLQARGRLTAAQLAKELEVSVRTVYRDVESLHAAGIPLYGDAGHHGGYQLLDGYRTRLTGLSAEEAKALSLSGLPGPAAELGLGSVLATAQLKVQAALPPALAEQLGVTAQRFHLDATGWYAQAQDAPFLPAVAGAARRRASAIGGGRPRPTWTAASSRTAWCSRPAAGTWWPRQVRAPTGSTRSWTWPCSRRASPSPRVSRWPATGSRTPRSSSPGCTEPTRWSASPPPPRPG